jgi:multiple sugar transport system ATP-binding protein
MRVELSQLHRDLEATMVYVTHDQIEAMTMAHRIVVLNKGRVEQFGTPMELYHHPATRFVATFIGQPNMNLLPAKVLGTTGGLTVELVGGHKMTLPVDTATAKVGDMVEVGMRPENVHLGEGLTMALRVLERLGGVSICYGEMADGTRFCAALPGDAAVTEGQTVGLTINPADVHVFDANGRVMRRQSVPALAA